MALVRDSQYTEAVLKLRCSLLAGAQMGTVDAEVVESC